MDLRNKNLDDIAVESLRCKLTIKELIALFEMLNVDYSDREISLISLYRKHIKKVCYSVALGY